MERRKWEDMNTDCLANIFGRVGIDSLGLNIPFVCKSWYKATLNPLCWQYLNLQHQYVSIFQGTLQFVKLRFPKRDFNAVLKSAANRSQGCTTEVVLPKFCTTEELLYLSEKCPALKFLSAPKVISSDQSPTFPSIISKWKNLEKLELCGQKYLKEIIVQVSLHCKNFVGLSVTYCKISVDEAQALVTLLPNIKHLVLHGSELKRSDLVTILKGCRKLVHFDVSNCFGFKSNDAEILERSSQITTFICKSCDSEYSMCRRMSAILDMIIE
ncbi:hypothetical protein LguiB_026322 [Lonicera macranthoides]